ncbi:hypothetical protein H4J63_13780 [Pseudoalteromonas sp. 5Ae-yellow]|uniref:ABC-three component system middle component 6 n=1 Tax=Pseudoalteromonas sp. 5Ae-yellow TaxID=2759847 RepID=UPI0015F39765|nr:ABC-three component system middle component 6 [Pseudoalteromonas sp. 5Ae-yellow]MBA6410369.1 hypothetical protein [Pseudoalteromonas sp. 5Ae-yellow]
MIVNKDISPTRKIYYLGAIVLEVIADNGNSADFFFTYDEVKKSENISMNLFTLTLDWLFIVGAITSNEGSISRCS